jgi:hypothetical protein
LAASTRSAYSEANLRSGATDGQTNFWGAGSADGIYYFGTAAPPAAAESSLTNCRVVNVVDGTLFFSTQSGTNGLYSLAGLPTAATEPELLINTGGSTSPEDFVINSAANLAYVADDSKGGGIQHWQYSNGSWMYVYTLDTGVANVGARSLTVDFSGAQPVIYAITAETSSNRLISIADSGPTAAAVTLATAPANELYRAVKFTPAAIAIPAPSLGGAAFSGGKFSFNVTGGTGSFYVVQSSSNLIDWTSLQTNAAPFAFTLTNTANSSPDFFRAASLPSSKQ